MPVLVSVLVLSAILPLSHALNVGVQTAGTGISLNRKCESEFCTVPPFLRYGKYCGLLYSGCPGEKPCDACCMKHDSCVQSKQDDYLSQECMAKFKKTGGHNFKGSKCVTREKYLPAHHLWLTWHSEPLIC